jgi:hypothetical protein
MKNKTKNKNPNKYLRLFRKYSKTAHLTEKQIKKLMKTEFKLVYNKNIMNSFMAIWSSNIDGKQVITKSTFVKLFKGPDGFFRDITL